MNARPLLFVVDFLAALVLYLSGVVALSTIQQPTTRSVDAEGVYMVRVDWPQGDNDVDLYLQLPDRSIVYFAHRESGVVHLERDDLGNVLDSGVNVNEERATFRGVVVGETIVNIHAYRLSSAPVRVRVRLYKLRGADRVVHERTVTLARQGDEKTAYRFTIGQDGAAGGFSTLPKALVGGGGQGAWEGR